MRKCRPNMYIRVYARWVRVLPLPAISADPLLCYRPTLVHLCLALFPFFQSLQLNQHLVPFFCQLVALSFKLSYFLLVPASINTCRSTKLIYHPNGFSDEKVTSFSTWSALKRSQQPKFRIRGIAIAEISLGTWLTLKLSQLPTFSWNLCCGVLI